MYLQLHLTLYFVKDNAGKVAMHNKKNTVLGTKKFMPGHNNNYNIFVIYINIYIGHRYLHRNSTLLFKCRYRSNKI